MNNKWMRIVAALAAALGLAAGMAACTSNSEDGPGGQPPVPVTCDKPDTEISLAELEWTEGDDACEYTMQWLGIMSDGIAADGESLGLNVEPAPEVRPVDEGVMLACTNDILEITEMPNDKDFTVAWCDEGYVALDTEAMRNDMASAETMTLVQGDMLMAYADYATRDYGWSNTNSACAAGT